MPIEYGSVSYNALTGVGDGDDLDHNPDVLPPRGTMTLTPSRGHVLVADTTPPGDYFLRPRVYPIDPDTGDVIDPATGLAEIVVESTESAGTRPVHWRWIASFQFEGGITRTPVAFHVPPGGHVNIALADPVDVTEDGLPIVVGPKGDPGADGSEYPVVHHYGDPDVARPDTDLPVTWYGWVHPDNSSDELDTWVITYDASTGVGGSPSVPLATESRPGTVMLRGPLAGTGDDPQIPLLSKMAPITDLSDPERPAGAAVRAAINSFGPKVGAAGEGSVRWWPPSPVDPDPAECQPNDMVINYGTRTASNTPGMKVFVDGQWLLVAGAAEEEPEPPVATQLNVFEPTATATEVTVRWEVVPGTDGVAPDGVRIVRTNPGGATATVDRPASGTYTFTGTAASTTYTLTVQMLVDGTPWGAAVTRTVTSPAAGGGTGPTATTLTAEAAPGDGTIGVTWRVVPGTDGLNVTGVYVQRSGTDAQGGAPNWGTTGVTNQTSPFLFTNLTNGTPYTISFFLVVGGVQQTTPIATKTVTPAAGTGGEEPGGEEPGGNPNPGTGTGRLAHAIWTPPARGWFSGASGSGIDNENNAFGNWRGDPVDSMSHWAHGNASTWASVWNTGGTIYFNQGPARNHRGVLVLATGGPSNWSAAASGSYDNDWRQMLRRLKVARTIDGVLRRTIIQLAHEFNGNWYGWSVDMGETAAFKATWIRWRGIFLEECPEPQFLMGWAVNGEDYPTQGVASAAWPGSQYVDALGLDRYNQFPYIGRGKNGAFVSWAEGSMAGTDNSPKGAERWRRWAEARGVPMYFGEYQNNAEFGDDPYWIREFYKWLRQHAGRGPGQIFLENIFNMPPHIESGKWEMYPGGRMPNHAAAYRDLHPFPAL